MKPIFIVTLSILCTFFTMPSWAKGWDSYVPYGDVGGMGAVNCPVDDPNSGSICISLSCTDERTTEFVLVITGVEIHESQIMAGFVIGETLAGEVALVGGYADGLAEFVQAFDAGKHMTLVEALQLSADTGVQAMLELDGETGGLSLPLSLDGGLEALAGVLETCDP